MFGICSSSSGAKSLSRVVGLCRAVFWRWKDLDTCAARELQEETGLTGIELHQLYAFGAIDRDPRHRTVSVAYWGVDDTQQKAVGGDDAAKAQWFALNRLPDLAFDHAQIIARALLNTEVKAELS